MTAPIALGSRRELFVDHFLIEHLNGEAALHLHPPIRREVVYQVSQPWDNACTGCYNLTQDGDRILLYYRGFYPIGADYADGAGQSDYQFGRQYRRHPLYATRIGLGRI